MSGTSADGVDAALVGIESGKINFQLAATTPYSTSLQDRLLELNNTAAIPLGELVKLDTEIATVFAETAVKLIRSNGGKDPITTIGSHGQTVFHQPNGPFPGTLQLGNASVIAQLTGIDTVADFRSADIACGGQGAPLTPAFNKAIFEATTPRVVLNLGGIANLTILHKKNLCEKTLGFDTGPANTLVDAWIKTQQNKPYDNNGAWAKTGVCSDVLLSQFLSDPYFSKEPPKSTGPDYFNLPWVQAHINRTGEIFEPQDVQATLVDLTATSIARSIKVYYPNGTEILLCGGGSHNAYLVERLVAHCDHCSITTTEEASGLDVDHCESVAFAWLAYRYRAGLPGNLPSVTGAKKSVVLGALHRAPIC